MWLGAEIGLFVVGIYYLITGKAKVNKTHQLTGLPVRWLGLMLMAVLPLAIIIGLIMGVMIALGYAPPVMKDYLLLADLISLIAGAFIAGGYYLMIKDTAQEITPAN